MNSSVFKTLTAIGIVLLLGATEAFAQNPKWVMDGAGCVPSDRTIKADSYIVVGGRIKFNGSRTGGIAVICPVSAGLGTVSRIGVSYRDSTGSGKSARVSTDLRRIRKTDGHVENVTGTGLTFSSDNHATTKYTFALGGSPSDHTLDDVNYYYFVQVTLVRSNATEVAEFGGVELLKAID
jgi:hypothetical protein